MAIITIPAGSTTAFLQDAINGAASNDIIEFQGDMNLTAAVTIVDKELTLQSTEGENFVLTQTVENARHFTIGADATVSMHYFTLDGNGLGGGISISRASGALNMYEGAVISNCYTSFYGGGINNSGTFNMYGGEISSNAAGVDSGGIESYSGTVVIHGGSIISNFAPRCCGGVSNWGGTITINDGNITGNTALLGGGVYNSNGTVTINGGNITDNTALERGGGVYNGSYLVIECVVISDNTAKDGGGIFNDGSLVINDGIISGNTAVSESGGVHNDGTFTMNNSTISDNTAGTNGGGVHNFNLFNMNGGEISGNIAGNDGGGIHSTQNVNINSGSIVNNTATHDGGGVWINDLNLLTVSAGVIFSGNHARHATQRDPTNNAVYRANIHSHATVWSVGRQGYNNYDINQDSAPFPPIDISDSALLIGNGTDDSNRSNAFIFDFNGNAFAQNSFISNGADYAEMFEWADGNPTDEDRVGYFVTLEGSKIRKANAEDEFVLGVVSGDS
ncbi:MAG: hypothetical protein FWC89_14015 [Defluviitaleaceae bacterium]|nr:hypothetical protein [Defluviitaleaceae bacterium]